MANGTGSNPELERVLQIHKRQPKRFAVLQWVAHVEFYETEDEARGAMAKVPVKRRAAIVDRETGETPDQQAALSGRHECATEAQTSSSAFSTDRSARQTRQTEETNTATGVVSS